MRACETDGRTRIAKELRAIRLELAKDYGGEAKCSNMQLALLDIISREWLFLSMLDSYIVNNGLLLDRRKRRTHGIIGDRNRMAATLADHMRTLGVRRKVPGL
jgi:hypothetical protein